jgi:hypothetical protein
MALVACLYHFVSFILPVFLGKPSDISCLYDVKPVLERVFNGLLPIELDVSHFERVVHLKNYHKKKQRQQAMDYLSLSDSS